jgi:hypothetical protein
MKRFSTQNHNIGYVKFPSNSWDSSPVRVVQASMSAIASGEGLIAPLEELGPIRIQLTEGNIARAIETLTVCQNSRKRILARERQTLLLLYEGEAHLHPSINLPSFQQFLLVQFGKRISLQYLKELSAGRKEKLLEVPVGTYTVYEFKILERFKCFVPNGSKRDEKGVFRAGSAQFGVKPCPVQIERLRQCWTIACELHGTSQPDTRSINKAVKEMEERYPEYRGRKPTSTVTRLKLEIEVLKQENQQLREMLARFEGKRKAGKP